MKAEITAVAALAATNTRNRPIKDAKMQTYRH